MDTQDARDARHLPVVLRWADLTVWLLQKTKDFPKHWRPTLVHRLQGEALDVLLLLTEAAYRRRKADTLRQANRHVSRLRILLEVAVGVGALSHGDHGRALVAADEAGRMLGGWLKQAEAREAGGRRRPDHPPDE